MVQEFLAVLAAMFIVIDPLGLVPLFISVTGSLAEEHKRRVRRQALLVSLLVLALFIVAGRPILGFLGVTPGAFYIAGGIMLFISAIGMIMGQERRPKPRERDEADAERTGADEAQSVAIFPLAIPLIAGPGAITTIILYMTRAGDQLVMGAMLLGAVAAVLACCYLTMRLSGLLLRAIGTRGVSVFERIMGLLLAGLAVQFVFDGLKTFRVL